MSKQIEIYDTTLRDGSQTEDINYTVEDKLRIAEKLDWLGIPLVEGGWPGASPKDTEFFQRATTELKLKKSKLVAFGSTKRADTTLSSDPIINGLMEVDPKILCLFGKTWDLHAKEALGISLKDNLGIISDTISLFVKKKKRVLFDAEHFFDGFKANKAYALECLKVAAKAGAERLVLCDTNGGTLPQELEKIIRFVRSKIRTPLGIHCHNDSGVAVYNSMVAVQAGVTQVQGTINGIGERCGNANLCTVMANLELKHKIKTIGLSRMKNLKEVSKFVDELANRSANRHQPYVGDSAFAHKGGVHVSAILKNPKTYEHIKPSLVGNRQRILVSELAGASTIAHKAKELGINLDSGTQEAKKFIQKIKELENKGYQFEGAEASFEIFIKKAKGLYKPHFELKDFKVMDEILINGEEKATSEAVIHLAVEGHQETATARGVGPVHAIDQALRGALERFYPSLKEMQLLDYKVRVLPAGEGTASSVRVLIECGDKKQKWSTVGVSENIIHASYSALVDAIDFKLMNT